MCILLALAGFLLCQSLFAGATVTTDSSDYTPGSKVTITGSGFQPGETVSLQLVENPDADGDSPIQWTVIADSNGNFTDSSFVTDNADVGVTFTLTATGQSSGSVAQTTFTDANAPDLIITKTDNVGQQIPLGGNWTWTITVTNQGTANAVFPSGSVIVIDNLPNTGIAYTALTTPSTSGGVSGPIQCSVDPMLFDLSCTANGATVTIPPSGSFTISFTATPSTFGNFANPRPTGNCTVDPNSADTAETRRGNNNCSDHVKVVTPDLTVAKTDDVMGSIAYGNSWTWTLTVSNPGDAAAVFPDGSTILTDNLPNANIGYGTAIEANVSGISGGTIQCSINGTSDLICTASGAVTIDINGSFTVTFTATPTAPGAYPNPRTMGDCMVDPLNVITEVKEGNNRCSDKVTVSAPDLVVSKMNDVSGTVVLGNSWTWTFTITNQGTAAATFANGTAILFDNLPGNNIGYSTPIPALAMGSTGIVVCSINGTFDLSCTASGGTVMIPVGGTVTVTFTATPTDSGTFNNPRGQGICFVDPNNVVVETNENNNRCIDSVKVNAPDLIATKTNNVNDSTTLGNNFAWTITIKNQGSATATFADMAVILMDNLPNSNISYGMPMAATGNGATGPVQCSIMSNDLSCMANGGSVNIPVNGTITVTFTAMPTAAGPYLNPRDPGTCVVDPNGVIPEGNEKNNNKCSDKVKITAPDLTALKTDGLTNHATSIGTPWTWNIHVHNHGDAPANFANSQTIVTDTLPSMNIGYGSPTGPSNSTGISGTITCSISVTVLSCFANGPVAIDPGGSFDVSIQATASTNGQFVNPTGGTCAADPGNVSQESNEDNNSCSDTVTVSGPDLTVVKNNSAGGKVMLGGSWAWTLTVSNIGGASATFNNTVILRDNMPNGAISYGSATVTNGPGITGNFTCTVSGFDLTCTANGVVSIASGGSFAVTFTAHPANTGTFANPRAGGVCAVDPDGNVAEGSETNNACTDSVTVSFDPDPVVYQTSYVANLNVADSFINITTTGSSGGNLCVNVYAFDPSEEMIACCSCLVTPNALVSLSAQGDLISNTLSPSTPTSLVIGMVATQGAGALTSCDPTLGGAPGAATLAPGLRAWSTTLHALPGTPVQYGVTENDFQESRFGLPQFQHLTTFCGFVNANGSGFGICKTCRTGGLEGAKK